MCKTYGLAKEGARHHGYTGQRGYHPLLAIAAGTGDVLMSRLREGRANTVRGAAHFLRETVGRVRHGGATGQLTVRADSGFYAHALVVVCREMHVRLSITIRQHAHLRELIETIPEEDWTPVPNGAWLAVQVLAHNLARWTARIGLGEQVVTTKTLRRRFFSLAGRLTRSARRLTLHLPKHDSLVKTRFEEVPAI